MKRITSQITFQRPHIFCKDFRISRWIVAITLLAAVALLAENAMAQAMVNLGTASNFAVLAGTPNITNIGATTITGDVGLSPATGAGITGFPPGAVTGTIFAVDAFGPAGSVNRACPVAGEADRQRDSG